MLPKFRAWHNATEIILYWIISWPVLFTLGIMLVVTGLVFFKIMFYCICKAKDIDYSLVFPESKPSSRDYFTNALVTWSLYMGVGLSVSILVGEYYKIGWALHGIVWPLGILRAWYIAHKTAELAETNE